MLESACRVAGPSPKTCPGLRWSSLRRCLSCLRAGMSWESLGAEAEGACCIPGALRARKPGAAAASLPHPSLHPLPQPSVPTTTTTIALPAQGSTKLPADPLRSASWRSGQNQLQATGRTSALLQAYLHTRLHSRSRRITMMPKFKHAGAYLERVHSHILAKHSIQFDPANMS